MNRRRRQLCVSVESRTAAFVHVPLPINVASNERHQEPDDHGRWNLKTYIHPFPSFAMITQQQQQGRITNIGLSTNFPRQSFNDMEVDNDKTLMELGLVPQAVLMVQDLDA